MSSPNGDRDYVVPTESSRFAFWILLAAVGIVIFLVGVTLGAVTRRTATVQVTTTVTSVATAGGKAPNPAGDRFGDGLYQVGVDIASGNYQTAGGKDCYWERLRDLSGGFSAIIANGKPAAPVTVRVLPSDKGFGVHGGCIWTAVS
jgi:hypothetical protein